MVASRSRHFCRATLRLLSIFALLITGASRRPETVCADATIQEFRSGQNESSISCVIEKARWSLTLNVAEDGVGITAGHFGELTVEPSELFRLKVENTSGALEEFDSTSHWETVRFFRADDYLQIWFVNPRADVAITVSVTGRIDERGISWRVDAINSSPDYSIMEATYPTPVVLSETLNLFVPDRSGRAIENAGRDGLVHAEYTYPDHVASMQYCAYWGKQNGVYLGVHDPDGCLKLFIVDAKDGRGLIRVIFPAINASRPNNSFELPGSMRWEVFDGDWYDATMIYKEFVLTQAKWLPPKGRPDTPRQFKEIPFWICDYVPNSESQRDARPMTLAIASENYGKDYWIEAPIQLKERLKTPVAYQVYNWHEIPFNINYPHFIPAREEFRLGLERLKAAGLYVFPYINAVSWEMNDADQGYAENFANTGSRGAAMKRDGSFTYHEYPQIKEDGQKTKLVPMCPSFERWGEIIEEVARQLEESLPIDGIYFDQVSAVAPQRCYNSEHDHPLCGGSYWSDDYNLMMEKIRAKKPQNTFYYSESNAEVYAKTFDGFLTWIWTKGDAVPAFPAIYNGYVQMLGRYTDGATRGDDLYFRYHLAQALTFGQQLGWINANVVYNDERMAFLEQVVRTRYELSDLFIDGSMLRPPVVETDVEPTPSSGIVMRQALAGAWKSADGKKTVLLLANISTESAKVNVKLYPKEYGVDAPETMSFEMAPTSIKVVEL